MKAFFILLISSLAFAQAPSGESLTEQLLARRETPSSCVNVKPVGLRNLPSEILSFQSICAEFRSRVALKIRDMRQNYQTVEIRPGEIEFRDAKSERILSLTYQRSMNSEKTNRVEWVRYFNADREQILEERIETSGSHLEYSLPATRMYFEGQPDYELTQNETSKSILIASSDAPLFRFNIRRAAQETRYDIFFGLTQVMSIRKYEIPTGIRFEYQLFVESATLTTKTSSLSVSFKNPNLYRIVIEKPKLYVTDVTRFFMNDEELYGMTSFLKQFNPQLYDILLVTAVIPAAEKLVIPLFPPTVRILNLAASGRFLDDLIRLKTLADQSKTNPAQLPQVSNLIVQFISSIQDGTLAITDNRPKH